MIWRTGATTVGGEGGAAGAQVADAPATPSFTGDVERIAFRPRFFRRERTLLVYLPPGYRHERVRRYPVLYLHDGQNVFDRATSASGEEWGVDETAERLITAGEIEPLIIVAVYHAGTKRIDEFTTQRDPDKNMGGKGDAYARLLVESIKPFIDRRYRTLPDSANTGVAGSSLGGLMTLHLGLAYPGVFKRLAALSPSIWWNGREMLARAQALTSKPRFRLWLDAGTREGEEVLRDTRALRDALLARGMVLGDDLAYLEADGGSHDERSWAGRVEGVLRFLFPPR